MLTNVNAMTNIGDVLMNAAIVTDNDLSVDILDRIGCKFAAGGNTPTDSAHSFNRGIVAYGDRSVDTFDVVDSGMITDRDGAIDGFDAVINRSIRYVDSAIDFFDVEVGCYRG